MHTGVSIIMPAFNAATTIAASIRSVLSQRYADWELIIVNDGSTDGTREAVAPFLVDRRISLVDQPNRGVAAARNAGIARAQGAYVAFLDSDDLWEPDKLLEQTRCFESSSDPLLGLVYTGYRVFQDAVAEEPAAHEDIYRRYLTVENDYHRLLLYCYIGTLTVLVKKQVLVDVGPFDETLHGTEDWDLWLRIARSYHIAMLDAPLARYRMHAAGISKNLKGHFRNEMKVLEKHALHGPAIPSRIRTLGRWFLHARMVHYHFYQREYGAALIAYARMIGTMPFNILNIVLPCTRLRGLLRGSGKRTSSRPTLV